MLHVGIFTDNDFGKVNGVTTSLRAALDHAPSDLQLRVYTCDGIGVDTPSYLAVKARGIGIPFYSEMKMYVPPFRCLLRHAQHDRLDVIHLTTPGPVGLSAMHVASRLHVPMMGSFHTHLAEYTARLSGSRRLGALMGQYLRWPYGKCLQVLAPSEATRTMLVAGQIDPRKLRVWKRGVCTTRFDPSRRSTSVRSGWEVSDRRPAILYVGRLSREKGLADLDAVRRALEARGVEHRFIFVGDGPMRGELEGLFRGALFTGSLGAEEVAIAMASADLFVFPSRTDTAGNVVLEAQASGLPVIVTDEGGPRENVLDGRTGIVCYSLRDFIRHAGELCVRRHRRHDMGAAARAYALGRSWDTALVPLYESYREVAASRARTPGLTAGSAAA